MSYPARLFALMIAAFLLCQCGVPQPPKCRQVPRASRQDAQVLLAEARQAWGVLRSRSSGVEMEQARVAYNLAVKRLFDQLRCGGEDWDKGAANLGTVVDRSATLLHPDQLDAVVDLDAVHFKKLHAHHHTEGVGVAMVGWKITTPVGVHRQAYQLPNGIPCHLNVVLNFDGKQPQWEFRNCWYDEFVTLGTTRHTLACDWSAPNEFFWRMCQLDDLLLQNLFLPDRFTEETGLYFLTPYDPQKIPVVFVHGLVSSPDAFKNVLNDLMPQQWFRDRYQVWLYNYPTGNPWVYSSMLFREKMRQAVAHARTLGTDDQLNRMVVVGHSMGGMLIRSSVTEPGTELYDAVFRKPIKDLQVSQTQRQLIEDGFLYQPLREPKRVVFMAVPHRGSQIATWAPSRWLARAIRLPKTLTVELLDSTLLAVTKTMDGESELPQISSLGSLSPNAPTTKALADLPLPRSITFHSIVGDRGKGGAPHCSDGVVPYWSSHIPEVASQKIVPSNHCVPDCPEAAEELKSILQLHLKDVK